jgi:hypothetical protein
MGAVIHLAVSPSEKDFANLSYEELRVKAYAVARKSGFLGGSCMFHPYRENDNGTWRFSPHFHMIGYGWIHGTKEGYESHGWIVKNLGVRDSVFATAMYQLSHCGVHEKYNSVTWFGRLSYNKLRNVAPMKAEKHVCPVCGAELVQLLYCGRPEDLPEVDEGVGFWFDSSMFIERSRWSNG